MEFLLSLWHLAKQKRKTAFYTFFGTLLPGACKWFAEQWAGNHIVDWIDCKVRQMNYGVVSSVASSVWNWMAVHPLQVVGYTTCGLVTFFTIETRFRDTTHRERRPHGGDVAAERALASAIKAISDAMPPKLGTLPGSTKTSGLAEGLRDQFLTYGENSFYKIGATQAPNGILVSVTQKLDRNKALPCRILLVDLKRIENGEPCATAELHKPDGAFKYGRVFLDLASANRDLFLTFLNRGG